MSFSVLQRALATGRCNGAVKSFALTGRPSSATGVQSRSITDYMQERREDDDNITSVRS